MSTAAAATPAGRLVPARTVWPTVVGAVVVVVVAVVALLLQLPLLATEPVFVLVTTAVVAAVTIVGGSLLRSGERASGAAFAAGGLLWLPLAVDAQVPWGPVVSWVSTGLPAVALGVGIVHYRRRRPTAPIERTFSLVGLLLTTGVRVVMVPLLDPAALGFPAGAWWPAPWAGTIPREVALEISRATLFALAAYVVLLGWRAVRPTSPGGRWRLWPVLLVATGLAVAVAGVSVLSLLLASGLNRHDAATLNGVLVLLFVAGIPFGGAVRRGFGAGSARRLHRVRTPETVALYVRQLTGDATAELLYSAPDGELLDADGHRRAPAVELRSGRFWTWVPADGERIALLTGEAELGADPDAVREWVRAVAVVAESARPSVLLRSRLARSTALRVAEEMAFAEERERFRRDLHDGLHQTIAAARMDLDGLHEDDRDTAVVVAGLEQKMATALAQVQSLGGTTPATPAALDTAIESAAAQLRLSARVQVSDVRLDVLALPVFLLVREALTNVAKHAGTRTVDVCVRSDGRTVEIEVCDDGRGGAVATPAGGIGALCRRVEELGGHVVLQSPPGRGTALRASIPCV